MDTTQWPQGIGVGKPMEGSRGVPEKRPRPQKEQALNCPRCNSTNTKFCYYNNYSLSQPRYFCKTCRRYWTEGGSLRNVPVGGGSRKNKRSTPTPPPPSSSPASSKKLPDHHDLTPPSFSHQNPKIHEGHDLNLAYPTNSTCDYNNVDPSSSIDGVRTLHLEGSAMELLKTGIASRGLSPFMPVSVSDANTIYPSGFSLQEFKPSINFNVDGFGNGYGSGLQGVQETSARLFFPFEEVKQAPSGGEFEQHRGQGDHQPSGYWTGMLGGGSW